MYSHRFDQAVALAIEAFRHKGRKATAVPYITHLLAVCALVGEHGGDEDQMIAAVLHDYVEDIPEGTIDGLRKRFGDDVAIMVAALSDCEGEPKPPWRVRKESYIASLGAKSTRIKLISAADKLHNCRSIVRDHGVQGDTVFDRFKPTKFETVWYYRACVDALRVDWSHLLLDELDVAVVQLERIVAA